MLENAAESHPSSARFVSPLLSIYGLDSKGSIHDKT